MRTITSAEIRKTVSTVVQEELIAKKEQKSSLEIYRTFKTEIKEEEYSGNEEAAIWFQERNGCMRLEGRRWMQNGSNCKLCGSGREDLRS